MVISGLASIILGILGQLIFSSGVHLFPFLCGQFSELRQLLPWVGSGHSVVNFCTWDFGIYKTVSGCGSEYSLQALRENEWPHCLLLTLFRLFSLVSAFLTSLTKLILWLKCSTGKRQAGAMLGGKDHMVLLRSNTGHLSLPFLPLFFFFWLPHEAFRILVPCAPCSGSMES